MDTDVQTVTV